MKFLILNGPNINMVGIREPGIYGMQTFADLLQLLDAALRDISENFILRFNDFHN